ncbi:HipA domain-containing protein [Uliginosibacterium sediminicola]|uniref:HipA domain-containing protein n=1 Tax=Uliginosibacterium sediminicola TaxID=2024550 RepID=A0ABU9Z117_9RHOO
MTSRLTEFAVFIHLPDQLEATPAGLLELLEQAADTVQSHFRYGRRYAERRNRLALDPLSLALPGPGIDVPRTPPTGRHGALKEFGVIRDAAPDRWGRRVIENKLQKSGPLPESEYLRHAGSNRSGALDFRAAPDSPASNSPLAQVLDLAYLQEAAERIDIGDQIPARLAGIFDAGSSMGGARPKAVVEADDRQWLAKFALPNDPFNIPLIEYATLELARAAGLQVPALRLEWLGARPVLLIERFDRERLPGGYARRHFLSALTLLACHEADSPHMSYADLSHAIATHGAAAAIRADQHQLFARMVFNILVHNNDDHLRNHGFLFDPSIGGLRLSPLYDVLPTPSLAQERHLHLGVGKQGRLATLPNAMSQHGVFALTRPQASGIMQHIAAVVREWKQRFEELGVPGEEIDRVASAFRHPRELGLEAL